METILATSCVLLFCVTVSVLLLVYVGKEDKKYLIIPVFTIVFAIFSVILLMGYSCVEMK